MSMRTEAPYSCNDTSLKLQVQMCYVDYFDYNQKDTAISDYLFLKGSTCFRRFLRPSSGTHNCKLDFRYCQPLLLQVGIVDEMEQPKRYSYF